MRGAAGRFGQYAGRRSRCRGQRTRHYGKPTENTVTINAEKDQTSSVTLSGANIDVSNGKAAVSTNGEGNVSIELDGENTLKSGYRHAGLEKNNGGGLTIATRTRTAS